MATGPVVNQGKTAFVKEFLASHRDAFHGTVNEAWVAAGNTDSVSESLVTKMRRKLGLTGTKGTKGVTAEKKVVPAVKKAKSSPKEAKAASKAEVAPSQPKGDESDTGPGKSAFVQEMLKREPKANVKAINGAWTAAGNSGKISDSVIYTIKRELKGGVSTTTAASKAPKAKSPKSRPKAKPATKPTVEARPEANGVKVSPKSASDPKSGHPERVLDRVEDGIDDLIVELKNLGGMDAALESLRKVRRAVVRSHEG